MATRPIAKPSDASTHYAEEIRQRVLERFREWLANNSAAAGPLVQAVAETFDDHVRVQVFLPGADLLEAAREYASVVDEELSADGHFVTTYVRSSRANDEPGAATWSQ